MTIELVVAPSHVAALEKAASRSQLTLKKYLCEVVESHCASLLLPTVPSSGGRPGGAVGAGVEEVGEAEEIFPWPAEVYSLNLPR